jgi:hypothetical protein
MNDPVIDTLQFLDDNSRLHLTEMLQLTGFSRDELQALVESGALEPDGLQADAWTFPARTALIARRAYGLHMEFELDTQATSLVLGLIERMDEMERRMRELECQLLR